MANATGRLPDFIIIGTQKGGTSSMHHALANHDGIEMSTPKELNFFNRNFHLGDSWYARHFDRVPAHVLCGESSPGYMYDASVAGRIEELQPDVKLIAMLRNPVDRAYSAYWHAVRYGYEPLSFGAALVAEPSRLVGSEQQRRYNSYFDRGLYARQLRAYYTRFDPDNILTVISEEFYQDPLATLSKVAEFVGMDASRLTVKVSIVREKNKARIPRLQWAQQKLPFLTKRLPVLAKIVSRINLVERRYPSMDTEEREGLVARYREHNSELESLLHRDLSVWSR